MLGIKKKVVPIGVVNEGVWLQQTQGVLSGASLGCAVVVLVTKQVTAGSDGRIERKFSKNQVVCSVSCYCGKASGVLKSERVLAPNP